MYTPGKPQFYYIKVGFKGVKIYRYVFVMLFYGKFSYFIMNIYVVCSHKYRLIEDKDIPRSHPFASWSVTMINPQRRVTPMPKTNFHDPKDVRALGVRPKKACLEQISIFRKMFKLSLRKQAYSNILKILPPKNENFQMKILIFVIFLLKT